MNMKKNIWYTVDVLLILFSINYYFDFFVSMSFKWDFLNIGFILFFIFRFFVRCSFLFKEKTLVIELMNDFLCLAMFLSLSCVLLISFAFIFIFPEFERDTYFFPDNSKERIVVVTRYGAASATSTIKYEKEIFSGIICESRIDHYREEFYSEGNMYSEDYINYLKTHKLDIDYEWYVNYLRNNKNSGFCYRNVELGDINKESKLIVYTLNVDIK